MITPATQALLAWPYRLLRTELGRRTAAAVLVSAALATTVQTLYANADTPSAPAASVDRIVTGAGLAGASQPGSGTTPTAGAGGEAAGTGGVSAKPEEPGDAAEARERGRGKADADEPGRVAVAWYARKRGVEVGKVKLLQQRRKSANEVRVLVMVEIGDRIDTAEVTVRHTKSGWKVP